MGRLRLELEDKELNITPNIEFNSNRTIEDLFRDLEVSNPVARIRPNKDPKTHRGNRQMSNIVIETYTNFKTEMPDNQKGEKTKPSTNSSKVINVGTHV